MQLSRAKPGNPASIYIGECVYPSKHIHVAVCGPIGTKFGTHMQIHLEKVVGKIKICPVWPRGHMGGFRGQKLKNGGNLPNGWTDWHQIWHTYADSSGNEHRLKNYYLLETPGGAFWGVYVVKNSSLGNVAKRLAWLQDDVSVPVSHTINKWCPQITGSESQWWLGL